MRTGRKVDRREQGFTLMELLIIVSFISVVGAVSVPTIMGYLPNMRLREGGRLMYQALQQAKMEAIKRNTPVTLELKSVNCGGTHSISSGSYFKLSYKTEEDETCKTREQDGLCPITEPVYLSERVAMCNGYGSQENPEKITFKANGQPDLAKEEMAIRLKSSSSRELCVNLTRAGSIQIKDVKSKKCTK